MNNFKLFLLSILLFLPSLAKADVRIITAPANYEFSDMGYDSVTDQVAIVGQEIVGATKTPKVIEPNSNRTDFSYLTLVGLGPNTQVFGISSDASRIAGVSKSPGSIDVGEGMTWLRSAPNAPVATGYCAGAPKTSVGLAAWKDGVVGDCAGLDAASKWTADTGTIPIFSGIADSMGAQATGVSSNGLIVTIYSDHESDDGLAYYLDTAGIHKLQDPYNIQSIPMSVSPNGNYIGGWVGEIDELDNGYLNAAVWNPDRTLTLLKNSNGSRFEGRVFDISDLGYAVGQTKDGKGFIWHKSFDQPKIFEAWLTERQANYQPQIVSKGVRAIVEDRVNGKLLFALSDFKASGASFYVEVDVPEIKEDKEKYALWNSFLGMWNILEIVNDTTSQQEAEVNVYDINGALRYSSTITLDAGKQFDLLVHGLPGVVADSYGIVTIKGKVSGRMLYYRPNGANFDFAFAIPLITPSTGKTAVGFNTMQPSGAPVYNWLSLVNLANTPKSFVVRKYDQQGVLLSTDNLILAASSRKDIDGGHDNPGPFNVGLLEIIPNDITAPYIGQLVRYGIQTNGAIDFAFPLLSKAGSSEDLYVPVNTRSEAENWLEVANPNDSQAEVLIRFYNTSGALADTENRTIPAHGQLHFPVNASIGNDQVGHVQILSASEIISQSMVYERDKGNLLTMYGLQATDQLPLTSKVSSSYNLYIGMDNILRLNNLTDSAINFTLKVASLSAPGGTVNVQLNARESKDLDLKDTATYGTAVNTYGSVVLSTTLPKQVQAYVLRKHYGSNGLLDFAAPTVAQ